MGTDRVPGLSQSAKAPGRRSATTIGSMGRRRLGRGWIFTGFSQIFLVAWAILVLFPILWMVMTAFKTDPEIFFSPWQLPAVPQWDNFVRAWSQANIGRYFLNSVIVVAGSVALTLLLSSMAAYVLARYEFPGNRIIYYGFLIGLMFPIFLALVPLFFVVKDLHLLGTYQGALSGKVGLVGLPGNEGVLNEGGAASQAMAGVPVTARQVAKRSARVAR